MDCRPTINRPDYMTITPKSELDRRIMAFTESALTMMEEILADFPNVAAVDATVDAANECTAKVRELLADEGVSIGACLLAAINLALSINSEFFDQGIVEREEANGEATEPSDGITH